MANKREFKKYVDALGSSILDEMIPTYYNVKNVDKDKVAQAMEMVLGAIAKAKNNANVFFDRGPKSYADRKEYIKAKDNFFKALFNKIETEFSEEINLALKKFNEAIPAEVREQNKALAAKA